MVSDIHYLAFRYFLKNPAKYEWHTGKCLRKGKNGINIFKITPSTVRKSMNLSNLCAALRGVNKSKSSEHFRIIFPKIFLDYC